MFSATRVFLAVVLTFPAFSYASGCGTVNGATVCTDNPNCGFVNGVQECTEPTNCGWNAAGGDGAYVCLSSATNGGIASSMTQGSSSSGGGGSSSGGTYTTDKPVLDGVTYIATWLNGSGDTGQTGWFKSALTWGFQKVIILWIDFKIDMAKFAWGIVKPMLQQLNVSSVIQDAINSLDPRLSQLLMYCKVPEALNLILAALATAFVMRFIPFA